MFNLSKFEIIRDQLSELRSEISALNAEEKQIPELIEKTNTANNGDIIVALIDNNETTLKRLFKRGQQVALQPENESYETRIYGPDRIKIQGKLKQLIRQF